MLENRTAAALVAVGPVVPASWAAAAWIVSARGWDSDASFLLWSASCLVCSVWIASIAGVHIAKRCDRARRSRILEAGGVVALAVVAVVGPVWLWLDPDLDSLAQPAAIHVGFVLLWVFMGISVALRAKWYRGRPGRSPLDQGRRFSIIRLAENARWLYRMARGDYSPPEDNAELAWSQPGANETDSG